MANNLCATNKCTREMMDTLWQPAQGTAQSKDDLVFLAIKQNYRGTLDRMIYENPDLIKRPLACVQGDYGNLPTPLHIAAYYIRPQIVRFLLEHGADVNAPNESGVTPLWLLFGYNCTTSKINDPSTRFNEPKNVAAEVNLHVPVNVKALYEEHATEKKPPFGSIEDFEEALQIMLHYGADHTIQMGKETLLGTVLLHDPLHRFARSLLSGSKVFKSLKGINALKMLTNIARTGKCEKISLELFEMIIALGADVNTRDERNRTILHYLADVIPLASSADGVLESIQREKHIHRLTQYVLNRHASPNVQDCQGDTPLHMAVHKTAPLLVDLLIEHGAICSLRNERNQTPLAAALDDEILLEQLQIYYGDKAVKEMGLFKSSAISMRTERAIGVIMTLLCQMPAPSPQDHVAHIVTNNNKVNAILSYLVKRRFPTAGRKAKGVYVYPPREGADEEGERMPEINPCAANAPNPLEQLARSVAGGAEAREPVDASTGNSYGYYQSADYGYNNSHAHQYTQDLLADTTTDHETQNYQRNWEQPSYDMPTPSWDMRNNTRDLKNDTKHNSQAYNTQKESTSQVEVPLMEKTSEFTTHMKMPVVPPQPATEAEFSNWVVAPVSDVPKEKKAHHRCKKHTKH